MAAHVIRNRRYLAGVCGLSQVMTCLLSSLAGIAVLANDTLYTHARDVTASSFVLQLSLPWAAPTTKSRQVLLASETVNSVLRQKFYVTAGVIGEAS
jgi:hypothetical protein